MHAQNIQIIIFVIETGLHIQRTDRIQWTHDFAWSLVLADPPNEILRKTCQTNVLNNIKHMQLKRDSNKSAAWAASQNIAVYSIV